MKGTLKHIQRKNLGSRGDTIVEVLIAVVVVAAVMAGAFTVTQRSSIAVRDSQERGEMLQILQGQVEMVRALALEATSPTSGVFSTSPKYFCIAEATRARVQFLGNTLPPLDSDQYNATTFYHPNCVNLQGRYNVAIAYDDVSKVFTFTGRWDGLRSVKNQEVISYRIYPGNL